MEHPCRLLFRRAGPASAENRPLLADDLSLNEQITKGRVKRIRRRRSENDLRVTCDIDGSARSRGVSDDDAADFDVILWRNSDLCIGFELVVVAAELHPPLGEDRFVAVRGFERRLKCGRPELAARDGTDIAKCTPVVAGTVFAPARHRNVLPATVAATGVCDHDMISAVRQQLQFRRRRVRTGESAYWRFCAVGTTTYVGEFGQMRIICHGLWHPLLEQ